VVITQNSLKLGLELFMYVANLSCPEMCVVLAQNSLKLAPKLFIEYKIKAYASSKENIKFPFAEKGDRHPINRVTPPSHNFVPFPSQNLDVVLFISNEMR
jgi:hypothetical protein